MTYPAHATEPSPPTITQMRAKLKICQSHDCDNLFEPTAGTYETRALCPDCRAAQEKRRYTPQRPPRLIEHHIFYPDGYWR